MIAAATLWSNFQLYFLPQRPPMGVFFYARLPFKLVEECAHKKGGIGKKVAKGGCKWRKME